MSKGRYKLSGYQKQVLVGLMLGDGSLQTENGGKTYRLRVSQSEERLPYLWHLYTVFQDICRTPPKRSKIHDQRTGKTYVRWSFQTQQQGCFRFYAQQFYGDNGKKIPDYPMIKRMLNPTSLLYWFMDDGSLKTKNSSLGFRLCTDRYTGTEVQLLSRALLDVLGIKSTTIANRNSYRISIGKDGHQVFMDLVRPVFHLSMSQKLFGNYKIV